MATSEQIKAARALLRMEQEELAKRAGVSVTTIRRLEAADREYAVAQETAEGVQNALQEAGVEFIRDGVRRIRKEADPELVADLMKIAEESARLLKDAPPFTEDDLYDQNGLPA
ncbi:MAG: helix-turn-helix transcriptional regulator [Rhodomicrobium sp.]|jgi:transcriptional regulator with XRE-family HTH domain